MTSAVTSAEASDMIYTSPGHAPVVVAVDGSDDSSEAAAWAAERASEWGAPLHLIAAVPGTSPVGSVPWWLGASRVAAWRAGLDPDVTEAVRGDLLQVIADRGSRARLVVVPATVPGPVAAALAGRVACPVVVCRDAQLPRVVSTPTPGAAPSGATPVEDSCRATREAVAT
jgi:nucleotide-binding universal stress UspA family protein